MNFYNITAGRPLDISNLAKGIYILSLVDFKGNYYHTKFIKK
jgi:hypothetical protein